MFKKIKSLFLLMIILILNVAYSTNVHALDVNLSDAKLKENNSSTKDEKVTFHENQIDSKVALNSVGEYIVYEIKLDNNEEESYEIKSISNNLKNKNIKFEYKYEEDFLKKESSTIEVKIKYDKKIDKDIDNKIVDLTVNLREKDDIYTFFICLAIATIGIIFMITTRKHKN